MATIHCVLQKVNVRAVTGSTMPVPDSQPAAGKVETLTSSASSAAGTITGAAGEIWSITASGGKIWAAFGSSPTAVAGAGYLILDGQTRDFAVTTAGEKLAIKDA